MDEDGNIKEEQKDQKLETIVDAEEIEEYRNRAKDLNKKVVSGKSKPVEVTEPKKNYNSISLKDVLSRMNNDDDDDDSDEIEVN